MIVIDTNVISELMRPEPDPRVLAFADAVPKSALYTTTIVEAEILSGVALLPQGRRRTDLEWNARRMFAEDFAGRVLSFGREAAAQYALILEERRALGQPLEGFDGLIAAAARAAGFKVATRNTPDFEGCGVELINPWEPA